MTFATYASDYNPWTPSVLLPEPNDSITWDWYDTVAQFSQRLRKTVSIVPELVYGEVYAFDYSALGCDFFPPILKAYYSAGTDANGPWRQFDFYNTIFNGTAAKIGRTGNIGSYARDYIQFYDIGLGSCNVLINVNQTLYWKFIAYM